MTYGKYTVCNTIRYFWVVVSDSGRLRYQNIPSVYNWFSSVFVNKVLLPLLTVFPVRVYRYCRVWILPVTPFRKDF